MDSARERQPRPPTAWVAFHADGAWSVHCQGGATDGGADEGGVLGWTCV